MNDIKLIYSLKEDLKRIKMIQTSSLDKDSKYGYKVQNSLLFGTKEWFDAIDLGIIALHLVKGVVTQIYNSGHNDFPEFEIENNEGKTTWPRLGNENLYQVGKPIQITYVERKYKYPNEISGAISKCIIEIVSVT